MKIGFDAKRYYHNDTGLGNYSRTIVGGLQEFCHREVECVLYDEKALARTFRLAHKAQSEGCQLLHGLSNELPTDARSSHIPTVVTMHDVAWRTFPGMYHWIDRQLYDWKYGSSCQRATRIVAISESTKSDVMRFYGVPEEKIEVIYQPVARHFYSPCPTEATQRLNEALPGLPEDFLLNVGSINSRKNLLGVVQALERIAADQRPLLLVVGNGREYKQEVLRYIGEHGLEPYVRIETGLRDNQLLQALYARARAMVYPSHYEGFGLPVVEAALQQCPVITSTVSSLPEAAGEEALLVNPGSVDEIHEALMQVIDHPSEARLLGQHMEQYARQHFDPQRLTEQMWGVYEGLLC